MKQLLFQPTMQDSFIKITVYSLLILLLGLILTPLFLAIRLLIRELLNLFYSGSDAEYWHWGIYYNKDDPRLFVPARFGWGRTRNYGNLHARMSLLLRVLSSTIFIAGVILIRYFKTNGLLLNAILAILIATLIVPLFFAIRINIKLYRNSVQNDDDSKYWNWIFYSNKNDKRTFVPYRFRGGWTLNNANSYAKILLVLQIVITIFVVVGVCKRHFNTH